MATKPVFSIGSGININVNRLSFNTLNTGFVYLGSTGESSVKQISTDEISDTSVTSVKLANNIYLSGTPTAETAVYGTNNTQIATTEFIQNALLYLQKGETGNTGYSGATGVT